MKNFITCTKCKNTKKREEFSAYRAAPNGKDSWCKACRKTATHLWRKANPNRAKESQRTWRAANPKRVKEVQHDWYIKNAEKVKAGARAYRLTNPKIKTAHTTFNHAINSGKVKGPTCCAINNEQCLGPVDAHHNDYDKPLEVVGLCRSHHKALHRIFTPRGI